MAVKIQLRRGTAAEWTGANPVLMVGEVGYDTTNDNFRIGDGTTNWDDLSVATGEAAPDVKIEYSADGSTSWSATFTPGTHLYIRFSVDNGATWTDGYKFIGDDGVDGVDGGITGGTLTGDLDFDLYSILKYTEGAPAVQTHAASGALTLNCANGNIHAITVEAAITSVAITNAPANKITSLTLRLLADDAHAITWLAGTAVVSASTAISAAAADNSFNSATLFADNLQMGDEITVAGFTDTNEELNGVHRVISATTSKIVVDTAIGADEAAGESVTITRHNLYGDADAPSEYIPKDYTLWTLDGVRWNIAEVGEF